MLFRELRVLQILLETLKQNSTHRLDDYAKILHQTFEKKGLSTHGFSPRNIQRYFKQIDELFDVKIQYNYQSKSYHINPSDQTKYENLRKLLNEFEQQNHLQHYHCLEDKIQAEPQSLAQLETLLRALKTGQLLCTPSQETWQALGLQQKKGIWNLVFLNAENQVQTQALHHLPKLQLSEQKKPYPADFSMKKFCEESQG